MKDRVKRHKRIVALATVWVMLVCLIPMDYGTVYANSAAAKSKVGNAVDGSLVITADTTLVNLDFKGNVYIPKGITLTLTGTANITGSIYIFGTVNNNAYLTVNKTVYCLHYGSMMSAGSGYDYGYFNNYGKASIDTLIVQDSYLSVKIPDVSTISPTDPEYPPGGGDTDPEYPPGGGNTDLPTDPEYPSGGSDTNIPTGGPVTAPTWQDTFFDPLMDKKVVMIYDIFDRIKTYGDEPFNLGIHTTFPGTVSYNSDDSRVVTVDPNGVVTIHGTGAACIAVKTAETDAFLPCEEYVLVKVKPKTMATPKLKSKKKNTLTVKWKKDARATGYQVVVAKDKKFKKIVKTATIKKNKTVSKTFKKLKKKKIYYIRIRPYKSTYVGRVYGNYSKAKKCKIK